MTETQNLTEPEADGKGELETGGASQKIMMAVLSGDVDMLINVIKEIEKILISHTPNIDLCNIDEQRDEIARFVQEVKKSPGSFASLYIYLSDGYSSRLIITSDNGVFSIFPSQSNSSPRVLSKWEQIK